MSDGAVKTGSGKEHHVTRAKRKEAELDALLERFGVSTSEELEAVLAQQAKPVPTPAKSTGDAAPYDESVDPLRWIDEDVEIVTLVSTLKYLPATVYKRPQGVHPGRDVPSHLKATGLRKWVKNPFKFKGTFQQVRDGRALTSKHHYHEIDRATANYFFSYEKNPIPDRAIVSVSDFQGLHTATMQPHGKKSPCSTDALRELVRHLLQANAGSIWIDKAAHMDEPMVVEKHPNPYSDKYAMYGAVMTSDGPMEISDALGDIVTDV